jgi:minor histocompatibility antigen H13
VFKFYKDLASLLLSGYFMLVGIVAVGTMVSPLIPFWKRQYKFKLPCFQPYHNLTNADVGDIEFAGSDVIGCLLASVFAAHYLKTHHWLSNNLFGIAFSVGGIRMLSIGSYKNGFILLVHLTAANLKTVVFALRLRHFLGVWYGRYGDRGKKLRRPN